MIDLIVNTTPSLFEGCGENSCFSCCLFCWHCIPWSARFFPIMATSDLWLKDQEDLDKYGNELMYKINLRNQQPKSGLQFTRVRYFDWLRPHSTRPSICQQLEGQISVMLKKFNERTQNLQERLNNQTSMWVCERNLSCSNCLVKFTQNSSRATTKTEDTGRLEHKAASDGKHFKESFCQHKKSIVGVRTSRGKQWRRRGWSFSWRFETDDNAT